MKQTVLMIILTVVGTGGVLVFGPFIAVAVYYLFSVLRPQHLWLWALPAGVQWSQYVAIAGIVGAVGMSLRILPGSARRARGVTRTYLAALCFGLWLWLSYTAATK